METNKKTKVRRRAVLLLQKPIGIGPIKPKNPNSVFTFLFKITPIMSSNIPRNIKNDAMKINFSSILSYINIFG